jgi:oxygen-independent coproporphyrinogen-3 oxidase
MGALMQEMQLTRNDSLQFDTLYMGGGTPSVLDAKNIGQIIENAHQSYEILDNAEITLEVNPGTITAEQLEAYRHTGVNRIIIGVQSFDQANLHFLGRLHKSTDANLAVKWTRDAGFENIGLDLIYGLPEQTIKSWLLDLRHAVEAEPQHLSCYILTCEPGTPLDKNLQEGRFQPLSERQVSELFETTLSFLSSHGYVQYEISNFALARSDRISTENSEPNQSRHNQKYWSFVPYIGLGPSAHSFIELQRCWNHPSVKKYIHKLATGRLPLEGKETLSLKQLMIETVYLGLRQTKGISVDDFDKKFGVSFKAMFEEITTSLEEKGLVKYYHNRCTLTPRGMLFLDSIAAMFTQQIP